MNTTIQINGKIYDVKTGKVLASKPILDTPKSAPPQASKNLNKSNGIAMDGVIKRPPKRTKNHPVNTVPSSHTQRSQTLHRKAVKKPAPTTHIHSTSTIINSKVEQSATGRGVLTKRVPDIRLAKAMSTTKSNLISKFDQRKRSNAVLTNDIKPSKPPKQNHTINNPKQHANSIAPTTTKTINPKKYVFEERVKDANNHLLKPVKKQPHHKSIFKKIKIRKKGLAIMATVMAFVVLGSFMAYQSIPQVSMRIAASEAGFMGKIPKTIPAGYAMSGPAQAENDSVLLKYASKSDSRQFVIVQKSSNWSSESLLTNFVLDTKLRYQSYVDKGLTVYIYDGGNATWVDGGIWYNIKSADSSLSTSQLLEIASSI